MIAGRSAEKRPPSVLDGGLFYLQHGLFRPEEKINQAAEKAMVWG